MLRQIIFIIAILTSFSCHGNDVDVFEQTKKERMINDLDIIKSVFQTSYAPKMWKKKHLGHQLQHEIDLAKDKILNATTITIKDFQLILKDFFNSFKDYHVYGTFFSTESSKLPFRIQEANGRYFFTFVNPDAYLEQFPFEVGDELALFDGVPVLKAIEELRQLELGYNNASTDWALAEFYLTSRVGSLGHTVPEGTIEIAGYKKGSCTLVTHELAWDYTTEKVSEMKKPLTSRHLSMSHSHAKSTTPSKRLAKHAFFQKRMIFPPYESIRNLHANDPMLREVLGTRNSFLPPLGEIIWETSEEISFHAYVFEMTNGEKGGYIRIPNYSAEDYDTAFSAFATLIEKFEEFTDVLVIDQLNNPGGNLLYMYALASLFAHQPFLLPKQRLSLSQEDVYFAANTLPTLELIKNNQEAKEFFGEFLNGMEVDMKLIDSLKNYSRILLNEWNMGRQLSSPLFLYGIESLRAPASTCYTKPILLLVNSLDFSCGDMFPAILQDNDRCTIIGTNTAGSGGAVETVTFPNLNGISNFHYTSSIAERIDRRVIENFGIQPDIYYKISDIDLQNGYIEYVGKILETLESLLDQSWKYPLSKKLPSFSPYRSLCCLSATASARLL